MERYRELYRRGAYAPKQERQRLARLVRWRGRPGGFRSRRAALARGAGSRSTKRPLHPGDAVLRLPRMTARSEAGSKSFVTPRAMRARAATCGLRLAWCQTSANGTGGASRSGTAASPGGREQLRRTRRRCGPDRPPGGDHGDHLVGVDGSVARGARGLPALGVEPSRSQSERARTPGGCRRRSHPAHRPGRGLGPLGERVAARQHGVKRLVAQQLDLDLRVGRGHEAQSHVDLFKPRGGRRAGKRQFAKCARQRRGGPARTARTAAGLRRWAASR